MLKSKSKGGRDLNYNQITFSSLNFTRNTKDVETCK